MAPNTADAAENTQAVSPRSALAHFLELYAQDRYDEASEFLDLPPTQLRLGAQLARRLALVLEHIPGFDPLRASSDASGRQDDGLPGATDEVATVLVEGGGTESVLMVRRACGEHDLCWRFSRATVMHVDDWYARLAAPWLYRWLPEALWRHGPRQLYWWQWIALPSLTLLALGLGRLLSRLSLTLLRRALHAATASWDITLLIRLGGPLGLAWTAGLLWLLLVLLDLGANAERQVGQMMRAALLLAAFWTMLRGIHLGRGMVLTSSWARDRPMVAGLMPLLVRFAQVSLVLIAGIATLSALGFPVASLIAGLGIGGLAVALAAQKTVENLFGSLSLGVDQPLRVGDMVRIDDIVGTVEQIGLRSTRVRTLDRTVVTCPNGKLADTRIENYSERDRFRLACTIALGPDTTVAQLREVLDGLERVLREHPNHWPEGTVVRLKELSAVALDIEVMAWFETGDFGVFQQVREELLMRFMAVIAQAGTSLAGARRPVQPAASAV